MNHFDGEANDFEEEEGDINHEPGWVPDELYSDDYFETQSTPTHPDTENDCDDRYAARYGVDKRNGNRVERVFDRVVFALVPVKSRFEATAKAAVAFDRAPKAGDVHPKYSPESDGPLIELASAYDKSCQSTFAGDRDVLPDAVSVFSEVGQNLFADGRTRTVWRDEGEQSHQVGTADKPPVLFDEYGEPIERWSRLVEILENTPVPDAVHDNEELDGETIEQSGSKVPTLWIVPGFAFRPESKAPQPIADPIGANRQLLSCDVCATDTVHKLTATERLEEQAETSKHPAGKLSESFVDEYIWELKIWECSRCGAHRS